MRNCLLIALRRPRASVVNMKDHRLRTTSATIWKESLAQVSRTSQRVKDSNGDPFLRRRQISVRYCVPKKFAKGATPDRVGLKLMQPLAAAVKIKRIVRRCRCQLPVLRNLVLWNHKVILPKEQRFRFGAVDNARCMSHSAHQLFFFLTAARRRSQKLHAFACFRD